jgi:hypothetical protein
MHKFYPQVLFRMLSCLLRALGRILIGEFVFTSQLSRRVATGMPCPLGGIGGLAARLTLDLVNSCPVSTLLNAHDIIF